MLVRRIPWTSQPPAGVGIDWTNSITKDLQLTLCPSQGYSSAVRGEVWTSAGVAPPKGVSPGGISLGQDSAQGHLLVTPAVNLATAAQTHLLIIGLVGISTDGSGILACSNAGSSAQSFGLIVQASTIWINTGTQTNTGRSFLLPTSKVILTGDAAGSTLYIDGANVFSGAAPAAQASSKIVVFGDRFGDGAYTSYGKIALALSWTRRLSTFEIAALSANPWQVFQP